MFRQALATVALLAAMVVPAHAVTVNPLFFETTVTGASGGGNLSQAQIDALITLNSGPLGEPIEVIGRVEIAAGGVVSFDAASGYADDMFVSLTCNTGSVGDCKTGFTANFDFTNAEDPVQIVKIAAKAGGPSNPVGVFFICDGVCTGTELQDPLTDPFQGASISQAEWLQYCVTASGTSPCPSSFPGVSNFYVFGTTSASANVPEPATLMLLGTGLVGLTWFARRRLQ